jgi:hypothetical protein
MTSTNGTCDDQYAMLARLVPIPERSFSGSTGKNGTAGEATDFEVPGGVVDVPGGVVVVAVGVLFCPRGNFPAGFVVPAGVGVIPGVELLDEPPFGFCFCT